MEAIEISIVSPVYKAEALLPELVERLKNALEPIGVTYEIVLVDDCSPDNSWEELKELSKEHPEIRGYKLSRNFGQHNTISAGIDHAQGKYVIVMDCDLQDRPEEIPGLYQQVISDGVEAVLARRADRQDGFIKRAISKIFYLSFWIITGVKMDGTVANFGIYGPNIMREYRKLREPDRSFPFLINWLGFRRSFRDVDHARRQSGSTSYSYTKLFRLAFDIILAFSDRPIQIIMQIGVFGLTIHLIMVLCGLKDGFLMNFQALLSSVIILSISVLGMYLMKVYNATKGRPLYVIESKT